MADGRLVFDTKINTTGFETDLTNLERKTNGITGSVTKGTLIAGAIRKTGEAVVEFGKDSLMTASQLKEVQNVIDTVFGDNADDIYAWAAAAKDSYGIAEGAALTYAGRFGTLFKTAGLADEKILQYTKDLVGLGGDFASFFDNDIEVALSKINSALKGETEAIDDYGIDVRVAALSEFMGYSMKGASQMEQLEAIYGKLMSDTTFVQGDFLKTQESFANQLRIFETNITTLKATVGETLLPLANNILSFFNTLFEGSEGENTAAQNLQTVTEKWKDFETAITTSGSSFTQSQEKIAAVADLAQGYLTTLETLEGKEVKTDEDVAAIQNAITALNTMYPQLQLYFDPATGKINENTQAIKENIAALQTLAVQELFSQQQQANAQAYAQAINNLADAQIALDEAQAPITNLENQVAGINGLLAQLEENNFSGLDSYYGQFAEFINGFDQYFTENLDGSWTAKEGMPVDVGQITNSAQNALIALNIEREALLQGVADAQAAVDGYNSSIESIFAQQAEIEAKQAMVLELMNGAGQEASGEYAEGISDNSEPAANAVEIMTSNAAGNTDLQSYYNAGREATNQYVAGLQSVSIPTLKAGSSGQTSTDGSHATGLPYVPFDNYVARLHVGEAVLNAKDAQLWRSNAAPGSGATADLPSSAFAQPKSKTVINIDGQRLAEIQGANNSKQIAIQNNRHAKGVGSK